MIINRKQCLLKKQIAKYFVFSSVNNEQNLQEQKILQEKKQLFLKQIEIHKKQADNTNTIYSLNEETQKLFQKTVVCLKVVSISYFPLYFCMYKYVVMKGIVSSLFFNMGFVTLGLPYTLAYLYLRKICYRIDQEDDKQLNLHFFRIKTKNIRVNTDQLSVHDIKVLDDQAQDSFIIKSKIGQNNNIFSMIEFMIQPSSDNIYNLKIIKKVFQLETKKIHKNQKYL